MISMFSTEMSQFRMDQGGSVYAASATEVLEHVIIERGATESSTNILDLDEVVHNVYRWKETYPGLIPYYTPCVNNHPMVLAVLKKLDIGFSCASKQELTAVLEMGVPPGRVWMAHPCKTSDEILFAQQNGIDRIACDSVQEIVKIHRLYPLAHIVLRIRVRSGQKFGCCPTYDVPEICTFAQSTKVNIAGVHVVIPEGKQPESVACLERTLREVKATIEHVSRMKLSRVFELILSGVDNIPHAILHSSLTTMALPASVTCIIETGRALVESAVSLVTNVQSKRVIHQTGLSPSINREIMYFINDGRYGSFEWWKPIDKPPIVRRTQNSGSPSHHCWPSSLWGPTCDSADVICERIELPELEVGDFLVFPLMGAYGVTVASCFNGFPIPPTIVCARLESTRAMLGDNLKVVHRVDNQWNEIESSAIWSRK